MPNRKRLFESKVQMTGGYMYWRLKLENRWIFPPHPSLRLPVGGTLQNFVMKFGTRKLESWGY